MNETATKTTPEKGLLRCPVCRHVTLAFSGAITKRHLTCPYCGNRSRTPEWERIYERKEVRREQKPTA